MSTNVRVLRVIDVEPFVQREVLSPLRTVPIVCLTTRMGDDKPLIAPDWLALQLGARARIVVIPTGEPTFRLKDSLPPRMDVYGGAARIWWPGLSKDQDPYDHPLFFIFDPADVPRAASTILGLFGIQTRSSVPIAPEQAPHRDLEQAKAQIVEQQRELRGLARENEELRSKLTASKESLSETRQKEQALRKKLRAATGDASSDDDPIASPSAFLASVCEAHARLYSGADAQAYPLRMLRIGPKFLAAVRELQTVPVSRIVDICAHVGASRAQAMTGLQVHPLRAGEGGTPQRTRSRDGAQAWRCALKVNAPSAGRLHWWALQGVEGGAIEFASVGVHDAVDIPE